ncbi:MAG: 3-hydroxyacyl-ACP dehydratase FabZ family protein [Planctomycetota bacterium]
MRWLWIDRIVSLEPGQRLVAIKNVSMAEDHLHDHFAADEASGRPASPIMPASLIVEGMAQTAGILVGHTGAFREKVILAKVSNATLEADATPGTTLRYEAELKSFDTVGASCQGVVSLIDPVAPGEATAIGQIDLVFSHLDQNRAGLAFPDHNFVFGPSFKMILEQSGIDLPAE